MDKFVITGGTPLHGTVEISGAKNSALPAMAASLLTADRVALHNVAKVRDIITMGKLLAHMGVSVATSEFPAADYTFQAHTISDAEAPYELVKTMRASILTLGPTLARTGIARVSLPGGCAIGARPIDLHLSALEKMGANIAGDETATLRIQGVPALHGAEHTVIPDRIEAGTFLIAGAITNGDVTVTHCQPLHLSALLNKL